LCEALEHNNTLIELSLDGKPFFYVVKSLYLFLGNKLDDKGISYLVALLRRNTTIRILKIGTAISFLCLIGRAGANS
jgi:hypothetical protein